MSVYGPPPEDLLTAAAAVRTRAYAVYSGFHVGAAIRDADGDIHCGCNVENAAYPEGHCAETSAIAAMVAAGKREIVEILVIGGEEQSIGACSPCGGCRQRIREFASDSTRVWFLGDKDEWLCRSVEELLPGSFVLKR